MPRPRFFAPLRFAQNDKSRSNAVLKLLLVVPADFRVCVTFPRTCGPLNRPCGSCSFMPSPRPASDFVPPRIFPHPNSVKHPCSIEIGICFPRHRYANPTSAEDATPAGQFACMPNDWKNGC